MSSYAIRKIAEPKNISKENLEILNHLDKLLFEVKRPCPKDEAYWWYVYNHSWDVVGFAGLMYYPEIHSAFLYRSGVKSEARGNGIQKRLIKVRETQARKDGFEKIITYTAYHNLASANSLISCGYKLYTPSWEWGVRNALYFRKFLD